MSTEKSTTRLHDQEKSFARDTTHTHNKAEKTFPRFAATATHEKTARKTKKYQALLIGNGFFARDPENLPQRGSVPYELERLAKTCADPETGLFNPENICVLTDAASGEILTRTEEFFRNASGDETLLFFYSGHASRDTTGSISLCAADTWTRRLDISAVSVTALRKMIQNCRAQALILVLDCHLTPQIAQQHQQQTPPEIGYTTGQTPQDPMESHPTDLLRRSFLHTTRRRNPDTPLSLGPNRHLIIYSQPNTKNRPIGLFSRPVSFIRLFTEGLQSAPPITGQGYLTLDDLCEHLQGHLPHNDSQDTSFTHCGEQNSIPLAQRTVFSPELPHGLFLDPSCLYITGSRPETPIGPFEIAVQNPADELPMSWEVLFNVPWITCAGKPAEGKLDITLTPPIGTHDTHITLRDPTTHTTTHLPITSCTSSCNPSPLVRLALSKQPEQPRQPRWKTR